MAHGPMSSNPTLSRTFFFKLKLIGIISIRGQIEWPEPKNQNWSTIQPTHILQKQLWASAIKLLRYPTISYKCRSRFATCISIAPLKDKSTINLARLVNACHPFTSHFFVAKNTRNWIPNSQWRLFMPDTLDPHQLLRSHPRSIRSIDDREQSLIIIY